jgi:hypothetical protein
MKTIYKDKQTKFSDLMEAIPPEQFLNTKTIVASQATNDPPGRTKTGGEEKHEVTTKIRLPVTFLFRSSQVI